MLIHEPVISSEVKSYMYVALIIFLTPGQQIRILTGEQNNFSISKIAFRFN